MKKDELLNIEAAEANIRLNEKMNENNRISRKRKDKSTTEANMAIQEEFYVENNQEDILPTYIHNNTPAIKINPKN
jgi:hypothetical protein